MMWQRIQELGLKLDAESVLLAAMRHGPDDLTVRLVEPCHQDDEILYEASSSSSGFKITASTVESLTEELAYTLWFS